MGANFEVDGGFKGLVRESRSFRRFHEEMGLPQGYLEELVDVARSCPCGANSQALRFKTVSGEEACSRVFPELAWAGYLKGWAGPAAGERPAGYIVVCVERPANGAAAPAIRHTDAGIAAQTILLAARSSEPSVGGCMIGAFKPQVAKASGIDPARYEVLLVIALGVPAETVVLEPLSASPDGSIKYWRDAEGVHHVPKRPLEDVLI